MIIEENFLNIVNRIDLIHFDYSFHCLPTINKKRIAIERFNREKHGEFFTVSSIPLRTGCASFFKSPALTARAHTRFTPLIRAICSRIIIELAFSAWFVIQT